MGALDPELELQVEGEPPPDPEKLADAVEALMRGLLPDRAALEALVYLARRRGFVDLELRRRRAGRVAAEVRAAHPYLSCRAVARKVGELMGEHADTVRRWLTQAS